MWLTAAKLRMRKGWGYDLLAVGGFLVRVWVARAKERRKKVGRGTS